MPNNLFEQSLSLLYILDSCGPVLTVTYEAWVFFYLFRRMYGRWATLLIIPLPRSVFLLSMAGKHAGGTLENLPSKDFLSVYLYFGTSKPVYQL